MLEEKNYVVDDQLHYTYFRTNIKLHLQQIKYPIRWFHVRQQLRAQQIHTGITENVQIDENREPTYSIANH